MPLTVTTLRNQGVTSIHGRRLMLDRADRLVGPRGLREGYDDATSDTTGTLIPGDGITVVDTTTNDTWLLDNPIPGAYKHIYTGTTSTGIRTIIRKDNSFAIRTSASNAQVKIDAQAGGLWLTMFGLSTTAYALVGRPGGLPGSSLGSTELTLSPTS